MMSKRRNQKNKKEPWKISNKLFASGMLRQFTIEIQTNGYPNENSFYSNEMYEGYFDKNLQYWWQIYVMGFRSRWKQNSFCRQCGKCSKTEWFGCDYPIWCCLCRMYIKVFSILLNGYIIHMYVTEWMMHVYWGVANKSIHSTSFRFPNVHELRNCFFVSMLAETLNFELWIQSLFVELLCICLKLNLVIINNNASIWLKN